MKRLDHEQFSRHCIKGTGSLDGGANDINGGQCITNHAMRCVHERPPDWGLEQVAFSRAPARDH